MVSQRQRLARKRYKAEHPELFPKPEPTPPKDPNKKKKKMSMFKRKRREAGEGPKKKGFRKHPLRVPGMKPGDSCFICKAKDHIAKACPQKAEWDKNKICLLCRQRGHTLKRCPNKSDDAVDNKLCYNCGETGHALSKCPHPLQGGGTKFASCFICNQRGHLSRECPRNTHGIYPKGGCCKICGGVTHLAKDCRDKLKKGPTARKEVIETGDRPRGQVTKFVSGDELDDDFMMDYKFNSQKYKVDDSQEINVKPKNKQGPKVVNFT